MKPFEVVVPGSKSHTHRALICASLAEGESIVNNALLAEDTIYTLRALRKIGVRCSVQGSSISVKGTKGLFYGGERTLFLGNSGTSMRFLCGLCSMVPGRTVLTGFERLRQRPVEPLIKALRSLGVNISSTGGFPPVTVYGGKLKGGLSVEVDASLSSQFISALLLVAPYAEGPLKIRPKGYVASEPYLLVTTEVMEAFGVKVRRTEEGFGVDKGSYTGVTYHVPPDASSATYPILAAVVTGVEVKVKGLSARYKHPDLGFLDVLKRMGAEVKEVQDGVIVRADGLKGIRVDMRQMPDSVPALAVAAAFAEGETVIQGIGHLAYKESNRPEVIVENLRAMGIEACLEGGALRIKGGSPMGTLIDPHGDHRIAMAFAIASLRVKGLRVRDEACVSKSFPGFWNLFLKMRENLK